jgi:hypothetical protein
MGVAANKARSDIVGIVVQNANDFGSHLGRLKQHTFDYTAGVRLSGHLGVCWNSSLYSFEAKRKFREATRETTILVHSECRVELSVLEQLFNQSIVHVDSCLATEQYV